MQPNDTAPVVALTCGECGSSFERTSTYLTKWPDPTCSRACRWARHRRSTAESPNTTCSECGSMFYAPRGRQRKVCGNTCRYAQTTRRMTIDPVDRFWSRVDRGGPLPTRFPEYGECWNRNAAGTNGYSVIRVDGKLMLASHYAWRLATDSDIPEELWALHTCDNPPCVRNDSIGTYEVGGVLYERRGHLWIGNHAANMADAARKGRVARIGYSLPGELHSQAKLTETDVQEIRRLYDLGTLDVHLIAAQHDMHPTSISAIARRKSWTHID